MDGTNFKTLIMLLNRQTRNSKFKLQASKFALESNLDPIRSICKNNIFSFRRTGQNAGNGRIIVCV
jgi:hypothetical protein